ncbi:MAG: YdeI/OmpD-associated family protein [Gammaproteobacteria bacterium]|nr:YdeI/OmpD-associated family protein [Gammaproteobacteria bacterium]MDD9863783.1 YdeI/OmpD-associated family protein [Gammaproteobacteria bacterium]
MITVYERHPVDRRNDYLSRFDGAKRRETKERRLLRMFEQLEKGGAATRMRHPRLARWR